MRACVRACVRCEPLVPDTVEVVSKCHSKYALETHCPSDLVST